MGKRKSGRPDLTLFISMIILIIGTVIVAVPFLWMLLTSVKTYAESVSISPVVIFPEKIQFDAYKSVINSYNFGRLYFNTILFIALRVVCAVVTASMAAYALGKLKFFGKSLVFTLILMQFMFPSQIFVIPQYLMIVKLKALNTMFALVFPGLVSAFGAFLLRQFVMSLPDSLEESAKIEGANPLQIYSRIVLPLINSGIVALGIFTALFAYKELMWPLVVNTTNDSMPLSSALAKLQGYAITYYPELMAAATIASIPMIAIYLIFQKRFIQGIATTGLKL